MGVSIPYRVPAIMTKKYSKGDVVLVKGVSIPYRVHAIESLDLSSFDTSKVTNMFQFLIGFMQ